MIYFSASVLYCQRAIMIGVEYYYTVKHHLTHEANSNTKTSITDQRRCL